MPLRDTDATSSKLGVRLAAEQAERRQLSWVPSHRSETVRLFLQPVHYLKPQHPLTYRTLRCV